MTKLTDKLIALKPLDQGQLAAMIAAASPEQAPLLRQRLEAGQAAPKDKLWHTVWQARWRKGDAIAGWAAFQGPPQDSIARLELHFPAPAYGDDSAAQALKQLSEWAFGQAALALAIVPDSPEQERVLLEQGFQQYEAGGPYEKEAPPTSWLSTFMCLGLSCGLCFGLVLGDGGAGMSIGLGCGLALGLAVGASLDAQSKKRLAAFRASRCPEAPPAEDDEEE